MWTGIVLACCAIIGALFAIARWLGGMVESRVMVKLDNPKDGVLTMIEARIHKIEIEMVRMSTWLEMNKALLSTHGGARHESPFEIDTDWMREKIVSSGYVPDPAMLAEFRRLALDPETPADDGSLWGVIELRFGAQALAQEVMKFNAPGETAPAIWILCLRKAQKIGPDELLREIGLLPEEEAHEELVGDDGA
jgi:hypothetical protein